MIGMRYICPFLAKAFQINKFARENIATIPWHCVGCAVRLQNKMASRQNRQSELFLCLERAGCSYNGNGKSSSSKGEAGTMLRMGKHIFLMFLPQEILPAATTLFLPSSVGASALGFFTKRCYRNFIASVHSGLSSSLFPLLVSQGWQHRGSEDSRGCSGTAGVGSFSSAN